MFHTYYFTKRLSQELTEKLSGAVLISCFSQQKDELILEFILPDNLEFYIKASFDNQINLLSFPREFHRARKNSVDLFSELVNLTVLSIEQINFDRSFIIHLQGDHALLIQCYGNRSNLVHLSGDEVISSFRSNIKSEGLKISALEKNIDLNSLNTDSLALVERTFDKSIKRILEYEYDYSALSEPKRIELIPKIILKLNNADITIESTPKPSIVLWPESDTCFSSTIEASNVLYRQLTGVYFFEKEKSAALSEIEKLEKKSNAYIAKSEIKLHSLKSRRSYEEIANIIMANLHQIQPNLDQIELDDFYKDSKISIKLNPRLTPQKNAENYYRKGKNEKIEIEKIEENIKGKRSVLATLAARKDLIQSTQSTKELRKITKVSNSSTDQPPHPFKSEVFQGYEILVGKHGKNNDELTFKTARKNDLWLHAKDVAGSHVVIRKPDQKTIPKTVIERAAELAAFHSKRKTDSLCPVLYTERKYVRKAKKAAPGQVIVDREQVILVRPTN